MRKEYTEKDYAAAEDAVRAAGYDLPIAWAMMFLLTFEFALRGFFSKVGENDTAEEVWRMVHEIKTGEVADEEPT